MKNQSLVLLSVLAVGLLVVASAVPAKKTTESEPESDQNLMFLAKLLHPLRELARRASQLEGLVSAAMEKDSDFAAELHKRQQQWEAMDYGWGGGRFGKRAGGADAVPKRYDMYGSYGRFGRDVDHVDPDSRQ